MGDELTEIRFFVPGNFSKLKGSDAGSEKSDDDDTEEISAAQVLPGSSCYPRMTSTFYIVRIRFLLTNIN
jgi:hypothetical protein